MDSLNLNLQGDKDIVVPKYYEGARPIPPKIIWMYWGQGIENAPNIVKLCMESWKKFNPEYDIRILDDRNLVKYIEIDDGTKKFGMAAYSDHIRKSLLLKYGGIWADATLFCTQPISSFVNMMTQLSQFFVFHQPAEDRIISNWFIASHQDSYLLKQWLNLFEIYIAALEQDGRKYTHAYLFAHYLFEYLTINDEKFNEMHNIMPKVCVSLSSRTSGAGRIFSMNDDDWLLDDVMKKRILSYLKIASIHKFTWKGIIQKRTERAIQFEGVLQYYLKNYEEINSHP